VYAPTQPGSCLGTAAPCELPAAEDFDALVANASESQCEPEAGPPGRILWEAEIPPVECPLGRCGVTVDYLFAAEDGSVWIRGNLQAPGVDWGASVGTALLRFDAEGKQSFGIAVDTRTRLAGTAPFAYRMKSGKDGSLLWMAPMNSEPGIELREHDTRGRLENAWPLARTINATGGGILGPGSVVLNYAYDRAIAGLPDAGPANGEPEQERDLARFDPPGGVVWNFTATKAFGPELADLSSSLDDEGILVFGSLVPEYEAARMVMARLDTDGRVVSRFESSKFRLDNARPRAEGGALLSLAGGPAFAQEVLTVAVDRDGRPLWRTSFFHPVLGELGDVTVDGEGRGWVMDNDYETNNLVMGVASPDARACATFPLDLRVCETMGDETRCSGWELAVGHGGRAFMGQGNRLMLAVFEGLP